MSKSYKIIFVISFVVFMYFVNTGQHSNAKSNSQVKYENWLIETEAKSRAAINNVPLPSLSITIIPDKNVVPVIENVINANNISDSKEKILRLLQLIGEAGLYDYQTEKLTSKQGDIILKITSPEKIFTMQFKSKQVESNVKAMLLLKLFEEYSKNKIPENIANTSQSGKVANLNQSIFELFENQDKRQHK